MVGSVGLVGSGSFLDHKPLSLLGSQLELLNRRGLRSVAIGRSDIPEIRAALADQRYTPISQQRLFARSFHP